MEKSGDYPAILYADDLVLCGELEKDLTEMVERFAEVCRYVGSE